MASYIAPAVVVEERDYSDYVAALATTQLGLVGIATKGPVDDPQFITSPEQFIQTFGPPTQNGYGPHAALAYLRQGTQLWYTRAAKRFDSTTTLTSLGTPVSGNYTTFNVATGHGIAIGDYVQIRETGKPTLQGALVTGVATNLITVNKTFSTVYTTACEINVSADLNAATEGETFAVLRRGGVVTPLIHIRAKNPGSWSNFGAARGLEIKIEDGGRFANLDPVTGTPVLNSNGVPLQGVQPSNPSVDDLSTLYALTNTTVRVGSTVGVNAVSRVFAVDQVLAVSATVGLRCPGLSAYDVISTGNTIDLHGIAGFTGTKTVIAVTIVSGNTQITFAGTPPGSPTAVTGSIEKTTDTTRQSVVFQCTAATGSGSSWSAVGVLTKRLRVYMAGQVVETFDNLIGYDPTSPQFWETAIVSNYITAEYLGSGEQPLNSYNSPRHLNNPRYLMGLTLSVYNTDSNAAAQTVLQVANGQDGDAPTDADYIGVATENSASGLQHFLRTQTYDVSLLAVPGISSAPVLEALLQVLESRHDCFGIIDTPFGLNTRQAVDWHNGQGDYSGQHDAFVSNAAAVYWPWIKQYDPYTKTQLWLPPSCSVAAQIAYSDNVGEAWYAPAGIVRGRIPNALAIERIPSDGDVEYMHGPGNGNAINAIRHFAKDGICLFSQRTLQRHGSALDRINVRRMVFFLEKSLATAARRLNFEQNDEILWAQLRGLVTPILSNLRGRRALEWFSVVCDITNNPGVNRNQNIVRCDINIIPIKSAEVIILGVNLFPSGANVEEIVNLVNATNIAGA